MKKKTKIILACILLGIVAIGGGVWYHVQKVTQEKQELIKKSAKEIDEFYKWNYIGVEKTTTGKLWRNPASGKLELDCTVYLENGGKTTGTAEWSHNIIKPEAFGESEKVRPQFKIPEAGNYNKKHEFYLLQTKDIAELKKRGYTNRITGAQILFYLKTKYPQHFE